MLFTAKFQDEKFISETTEANSPTYGDIARYEKISELEMFCLDNGDFYALLDFKDGRWEINENSFYIKKQDYPNKLRLIYYKTRGVNISVSPEIAVSPLPDIFNMGFQTNIDGENIKQILQIRPEGIINFIVE